MAFDTVAAHTTFADVWNARDAAVVAGLGELAPAIVDPLISFGPDLWTVVDQLPAHR